MSIGTTLAQARRDAGLTVTEVSQKTRIRETIIRGIERDEYSACGGDFYARGHIRAIARAVGTDPVPLIEEYDGSIKAPDEITAAEAFRPALGLSEREAAAERAHARERRLAAERRPVREPPRPPAAPPDAGTLPPGDALSSGETLPSGDRLPWQSTQPATKTETLRDAPSSPSARAAETTLAFDDTGQSDDTLRSDDTLPARDLPAETGALESDDTPPDGLVPLGALFSDDTSPDDLSSVGAPSPAGRPAPAGAPPPGDRLASGGTRPGPEAEPAAETTPVTGPPPVQAMQARMGEPAGQSRRPQLNWTALLGVAVLTAVALLGWFLAAGSGHSVASPRPQSHSQAAKSKPSRSPRAARSTPAAQPSPQVLSPVSAEAFGPSGTGQGDDPQLAPGVLTGGVWHTDWYATAAFGNLQQGTGLMLDMGKAVTITKAELTLGNPTGADLQLRVGDTPTLAALPPVAGATNAGGVLQLTPAQPVTGRYVLIWFTNLPPDTSGTFQASVSDVQLQGQA